jgi:hypothetical protein
VTHGGDLANHLRSATVMLNKGVARTPAYCPPEVLESARRNSEGRVEPSFDMWVRY